MYCSELVWETLLALVCKICMRFGMIRAYMRSRVSSSVRAYVRSVHAYLYMNGRLQGKLRMDARVYRIAYGCTV